MGLPRRGRPGLAGPVLVLLCLASLPARSSAWQAVNGSSLAREWEVVREGEAREPAVVVSIADSTGDRVRAALPARTSVAAAHRIATRSPSKTTRPGPRPLLLRRAVAASNRAWREVRWAEFSGRGDRENRVAADAELAALVRAAADGEGRVIVAMANYGYLDFFFSWLCHVRRLGLAPHVVGIALDPAARDVMQARGVRVYYDGSAAYHTGGADLREDAAARTHGTREFASIAHRKTYYVRQALAAGADVLFSDTDVALLRQPWPLVDPAADLQLATDWRPAADAGDEAGRQYACTGFFFARARPATLRLFDRALQWQQHPANAGRDDQIAFNALLPRLARASALRVSLFHGLLAASGYTYFHAQLPQRLGMCPVAVHVNYIKGRAMKRWQLRAHRLWRTNARLRCVDPGRTTPEAVRCADVGPPPGAGEAGTEHALGLRVRLQPWQGRLTASATARQLLVPVSGAQGEGEVEGSTTPCHPVTVVGAFARRTLPLAPNWLAHALREAVQAQRWLAERDDESGGAAEVVVAALDEGACAALRPWARPAGRGQPAVHVRCGHGERGDKRGLQYGGDALAAAAGAAAVSEAAAAVAAGRVALVVDPGAALPVHQLTKALLGAAARQGGRESEGGCVLFPVLYRPAATPVDDPVSRIASANASLPLPRVAAAADRFLAPACEDVAAPHVLAAVPGAAAERALAALRAGLSAASGAGNAEGASQLLRSLARQLVAAHSAIPCDAHPSPEHDTRSSMGVGDGADWVPVRGLAFPHPDLLWAHAVLDHLGAVPALAVLPHAARLSSAAPRAPCARPHWVRGATTGLSLPPTLALASDVAALIAIGAWRAPLPRLRAAPPGSSSPLLLRLPRRLPGVSALEGRPAPAVDSLLDSGALQAHTTPPDRGERGRHPPFGDTVCRPSDAACIAALVATARWLREVQEAVARWALRRGCADPSDTPSPTSRDAARALIELEAASPGQRAVVTATGAVKVQATPLPGPPGATVASAAEVAAAAVLATLPGTRTLCDIGFGGGEAAVAMLAATPWPVAVQSHVGTARKSNNMDRDISSALLLLRWLDRLFPHRVETQLGPVLATMGETARASPDSRCDLLWIDPHGTPDVDLVRHASLLHGAGSGAAVMAVAGCGARPGLRRGWDRLTSHGVVQPVHLPLTGPLLGGDTGPAAIHGPWFRVRAEEWEAGTGWGAAAGQGELCVGRPNASISSITAG